MMAFIAAFNPARASRTRLSMVETSASYVGVAGTEGTFDSPVTTTFLILFCIPIPYTTCQSNISSIFKLNAVFILPERRAGNGKAADKLCRLVIRVSGNPRRIAAWKTELEMVCHIQSVSYQELLFLKKLLMAIRNLPIAPLNIQPRLRTPTESSATPIHVSRFSHLNFA